MITWERFISVFDSDGMGIMERCRHTGMVDVLVAVVSVTKRCDMEVG